MESSKLRKEFLRFFKVRGHAVVESSSLLPTDQSVLFTTAGMQQFKQYFLGEISPHGKDVASCQKCFRTSDIDEVGDESHLTFFEMLGNFSFGGYGKKEAIEFAKEFLDLIDIKIDYVTVFGGDPVVPRDEESVSAWRGLGFSQEKGNLKFCGREDNFWGPTGEKGPCGPTTEIYVRGVEIWNLVFNEYYCDKDKKLTPLQQKGIDTGMGLERLAMISQKKNSVFETDLFSPLISSIPGDNDKAKRIIADHIRGIVFLAAEGVLPSNVERGYILRRIIRKVIRFGRFIKIEPNHFPVLIKTVIVLYENIYSDLLDKQEEIIDVFQNEFEVFKEVLEKGSKDIESVIMDLEKKGLRVVGVKDTLRIEQSSGVPFDIQKEMFTARGIETQDKEHQVGRERHREISRTGAEKKFKGGLADESQTTIKYHTATHLLLAALRQVLGPEIYQKGSNITAERLRFDFNYHQKLSEEQIGQVEDLVNRKIKEDIAVEMVEMPKEKALKTVKISFDPAKYGDTVKVYKIGDFSIELCGGPHIKRTGELGHFKIIKEESSSAGIRRLRAILE